MPLNSPQSLFNELCGVIHIHTTFSDGGVSARELINTAKQVGLNFVVITDHETLGAKDAGYKGFFDDIFVCVGYEHSDQNNINHYLVLGCDEVEKYNKEPQGYINRIKKAGGIGFIAHPIEKRHYFKKYPPYPWNAWNTEGFDGIELWNQMSDWLENMKSWLNFIRLFYPRRFLIGINQELLQIWDKLNKKQFISGIGGVDAHSMKVRIGIFKFIIFPIKVELKGIRTHIYLSEPLNKKNLAEAKNVLLGALKDGRCFISNYRRGDAKSSKFYIIDSEGKYFLPGKNDCSIKLPAVLKVEIPNKANIKLICNGNCIKEIKGYKADFLIKENGLYRIEVFKKKYAWIYSNPFPVGNYPL